MLITLFRRTAIFCRSLVVLYAGEKFSLKLRVERRLRVFANRILRQILGSRKDENEEWRRLHLIVCTVHLI